MSRDIWRSVKFQRFVLTRLRGIISQDTRHSVTFQLFLLTGLNGITSRIVVESHSSGTDWTAWCHISGGMTHCHIPAVLTELNGIISQETWHRHIPVVLTESTEWYDISGDMTLSHSSGTYWPDWMASHLGDVTHCHFHQSLLTRLHGITPQDIAVPLFSTLKSSKSHMYPGFIYLYIFHVILPLLFILRETVFLHSNIK